MTTPSAWEVVGDEFPGIVSPVFRTPNGTLYLQHPGVQLLARPSCKTDVLGTFLSGFDPEAEYGSVLSDPVRLPDASALCKTAGQLCYMSFGPRRTTNADAARYFANILHSGHGSVLEHACFSFLAYGISRSVTHELVRHRAGFAFSQVSQRYVSLPALRFVERPEFQDDGPLHAAFESRIDRVRAEYAALQGELSDLQRAGSMALLGESRTARRKRIQQAARALLPNETEAPILVSANVRAWRHFIEMRASEHADVEIRLLAYALYRCLRVAEPILFQDYSEHLLSDGTVAVTTETPKV